ncbi:MAG: T9SS type A sorting domain-containing protein, partial [Bacteroidota bacterium]
GVTSNNNLFLNSAVGTNNQTRCLNVAITNITYRALGATNATVVGLPRGITGSWNSTTSTLTISGAPDSASPVAYTLTYTVSMTGGCVGVNSTQSGTITVNPAYSVTLVSPAFTIDQNDICINTPMDTIKFTTTGANSASFFGLPPGVTGLWRNDSVLIYGNPSVRGTYIFSFNLTGGPCNTGTRTVSDTLIVKGNTWELISAPATSNQTRCVNTPIDTIIYRIMGATSATLGTAPAGLTLSISPTNESVFIYGIPSASGTYNFTVTGVGGCTSSSQNVIGGVLNIRPTMTISNPSNDTQTVCRSTALTGTINFTTVGATSAVVTGLPAGVSANFTGNSTSGNVAITGTPTVRGTFPFKIRLLGGCNPSSVIGGTGLITVNGSTAILNRKSSTVDGPEVLTTTQTRCVRKPIQNIVVATTGHSSSSVLAALPAGVTASFAGTATSGTLTISGTPTAVGTFNFQVRLTGTLCSNLSDTIRGTITVLDTIAWTRLSASSGDTLNQFANLDTIRYKGTRGASGAIFSGLPSGLIGAWNSTDSTATIFGTPKDTGLFGYRISFTGRCMNGLGNVALGTIKVDLPTMGSTEDGKAISNDNGSISRLDKNPGTLKAQGLVIYPVPTTGRLNVKGLEAFRKAKLTIVDQAGRILATHTWVRTDNGVTELPLNLEGFSTGVYYLHIAETDFDFMDDLRERSSLRVMRFQIK